MVVLLGSLPLLPNGKVDRRGLPEVDFSQQAGGGAYQVPEDSAEAQIQAIWQEVCCHPCTHAWCWTVALTTALWQGSYTMPCTWHCRVLPRLLPGCIPDSAVSIVQLTRLRHALLDCVAGWQAQAPVSAASPQT